MNQTKLQSALVAAVQKLKGDGIIKVNDEVASALKMSKGTFSAYLNGHQTPSKNFVLKFKNLYGIDLEEGVVKKIDATDYVTSSMIDVKAHLTVILSVLAQSEAARSGMFVGQVFQQLSRAVEVEKEAIRQELANK